MNKYEVVVTIELEATNQESVEDIVRDIFEAQIEFIDYTVNSIKNA